MTQLDIAKQEIKAIQKIIRGQPSQKVMLQMCGVIDHLIEEIERITYLLQLDTSSAQQLSKVNDNDVLLSFEESKG